MVVGLKWVNQCDTEHNAWLMLTIIIFLKLLFLSYPLRELLLNLKVWFKCHFYEALLTSSHPRQNKLLTCLCPYYTYNLTLLRYS